MALLPGIDTRSETATLLLREMFGIVSDSQRDRVYLLSRFSDITPDEREHARLALDWLVRTYAPHWLRLGGLEQHAELLGQLQPITSEASARAAGVLARPARQDAQAARRSTGTTSSSQVWNCGRLTSELTVAGAALEVAYRLCPDLVDLSDAYGILAAAEAAAGAYIAAELTKGDPVPIRSVHPWARQMLVPAVESINESMLTLIEQRMTASGALQLPMASGVARPATSTRRDEQKSTMH